MVDAHAEMTVTRITEMVTEVIPLTVIQVAEILTLEYESTPIVPLVSSISAGAFLSAMISYEYDVDPLNRDDRFIFYGCIPTSINGTMGCFVG